MSESSARQFREVHPKRQMSMAEAAEYRRRRERSPHKGVQRLLDRNIKEALAQGGYTRVLNRTREAPTGAMMQGILDRTYEDIQLAMTEEIAKGEPGESKAEKFMNATERVKAAQSIKEKLKQIRERSRGLKPKKLFEKESPDIQAQRRDVREMWRQVEVQRDLLGEKKSRGKKVWEIFERYGRQLELVDSKEDAAWDYIRSQLERKTKRTVAEGTSRASSEAGEPSVEKTQALIAAAQAFDETEGLADRMQVDPEKRKQLLLERGDTLQRRSADELGITQENLDEPPAQRRERLQARIEELRGRQEDLTRQYFRLTRWERVVQFPIDAAWRAEVARLNKELNEVVKQRIEYQQLLEDGPYVPKTRSADPALFELSSNTAPPAGAEGAAEDLDTPEGLDAAAAARLKQLQEIAKAPPTKPESAGAAARAAIFEKLMQERHFFNREYKTALAAFANEFDPRTDEGLRAFLTEIVTAAVLGDNEVRRNAVVGMLADRIGRLEYEGDPVKALVRLTKELPGQLRKVEKDSFVKENEGMDEYVESIRKRVKTLANNA